MIKYFAFFTVFLFIFYLLGFIKKSEKVCWMDRNYTTAIKGFSILLVVWAHSGAMLSIGGIQFIAGIGVALFLICSGYGLEISYQNNGLKGFWKKRLLGVCFPFWMIEFVGLLSIGAFSVRTYLLDFILIKPATGYGWFMGYIVLCYLLFYVDKRFISNDKMRTFILFSLFVVWFFIESIFFANPNMPFLRARQMLSFPIGVLLATKKEKIEYELTKMKSVLFLLGGGYNVPFLYGNNTIDYSQGITICDIEYSSTYYMLADGC